MYERVRAIFGPMRTLEILSLLDAEGTLNYSNIEDRAATSSDVVSDRLQTLRRLGLIKRVERSSRDVRYSITEKGRAVLVRANEIESLLSE